MTMRAQALAALLLAGLAGACVTGEPPLKPLLWDGAFTMRPGSTPGMRGSASMAANESWTEAGVRLDGAEPEQTFGWLIRSGACNGTGVRVGPETAYPSFKTDQVGHGEAFTTLNRRVPAGTYSAELLTAINGTTVIVACADLERVDPAGL